MTTDIQKLKRAIKEKRITPTETEDGILSLRKRMDNKEIPMAEFLTKANEQGMTVCPKRLLLVQKYRARLQNPRGLDDIIAGFQEQEPPSISPPELPKKEKKEKKDKKDKDKDNSLPTPQPDPEPEIVEEPALPEEIELYTAEELEAMDWADIRSVAKADEEVPGNVSKDEMIKLLTGRPKFPIA